MNRRLFFEMLGTAAVAFGVSKSANSQVSYSAEAKIKQLGLTLPEAARPVAVYVPYRISGNQVFIAGQIPPNDLDTPTYGKLGKDLTVDDGYIAAQQVGLRIIAQLKAACDGDLDRVVKCIQIRGFVNSTDDFIEQPKVINGASDLIVSVFGEAGMHTRAAISADSLPLGVSVEVDAIFELN